MVGRVSNLKLKDLRVLEGRNIKGAENLIFIDIEEAERKRLYWLISDYEFICRKMNMEGTLKEAIYNEFGGCAWLTYSNKELALFIIESLIEGVSADKLLNEAVAKKQRIWDYNLLEECSKKKIDFFKEDDEIIVGYGVNSKRISKEDYENKNYNLDLINNGVIPIVSITGTNGKTSTSRLIYKGFENLGYFSGLAMTGGIIINNEFVKKGDTTGFYSAKKVLTNPQVEVGVLETARGGILRKGLGFKNSKVSIITSLAEDHIGVDGIKNINDLLDIKLITTREVLPEGKVIIKAEPKLYEVLQTKENLVLFNSKKNEYIEKHMKNGKEAWFVEDENIIFFDGKDKNIISNIKDFKFTHNGNSKTNINNILVSIAAIYEVHKNLKEVVESLKNIECDVYNNIGRQNIIELENFKIILDYGHNPEAFEELFYLANNIKRNKIISIVSSPGDRLDEYIKELGKIAGKNSDTIIIKETFDRRGREKLEITNLIKSGIKEVENKSVEVLSIIDEEEAIKKAISMAEEGDIIVDFTQHLDVVIPVINEYLSNHGKETIEVDLEDFH
ncbi:ligase [Clostridium perfringens]